MILLLLALLLPYSPPRYLPGDVVVYRRDWFDQLRGEWAYVIAREPSGHYRVRLASQCFDESITAEAKHLVTDAEFAREAKDVQRANDPRPNLYGLPIIALPRELPE